MNNPWQGVPLWSAVNVLFTRRQHCYLRFVGIPWTERYDVIRSVWPVFWTIRTHEISCSLKLYLKKTWLWIFLNNAKPTKYRFIVFWFARMYYAFWFLRSEFVLDIWWIFRIIIKATELSLRLSFIQIKVRNL